MLPRLAIGVEWNPHADEVGPLANVLLLPEGDRRPALMAGISSDRIGTPDGTAYFLTASKDLQSTAGWPVSLYAGAVYGTYEDRWRAIGGARFRFGRRATLAAIHDGVNLHPALDLHLPRRQTVTLLWVDARDPGIAYSVSF